MDTQKILKNSLTFKIYNIIRNFLFNAPIIKYFFDPYKLAPLWYDSFLFKFSEQLLNHFGRLFPKIKIPKTTFPHHLFEHITGISILISALIPDIAPISKFSGSFCVLIPILILWIGMFIFHSGITHQSVSFTSVFIILCIFYAIYSFGIKGGYHFGLILLIPILFFIISSFSLTVHSDSGIINSYCTIALIILSALTISMAIIKLHVPKTTVLYTDTVALLAPLSVARTIGEDNIIKRKLYVTTIISLSLTAILLYGTPSCKISYFISLFIIITLIKPKLLLYILLFAPAIMEYVSEYLICILNSQIKYTTPIENIIGISRNLWSNTLSNGYKPFLRVYSSFTENPQISDNILPVYINESYLKVFYNIGLVLLFIFLWFSLKGMRNCLVNIFKSKRQKRTDSVCAVAFLVGATISGFVATHTASLSISTLYRLLLAAIIKV